MLKLNTPKPPGLLELAREQRWRLINLAKFEGKPPSDFDLDLQGALTNQLPDNVPIESLLQRGIPTVRMGQWPHPQDFQVPAVIPDHAAVGVLAAEHFAERDFKHVACIGNEPWGNNRTTYEAFASRAAALGCECHLLREDSQVLIKLSPGLERWQHRREQFIAWLATLPRPIGLLLFGDVQADRCCEWILQAGYTLPGEVAVLGIGNDEVMCECATVPISSIAHDARGVTERAVSTMARLIAGESLEQTTIPVPPLGVITRQSTDVLAASDPNVAKALRYMWEHISEDLSVNQIIEHVGVSRRTLETAFQRELKRGIHQEFQRRRLEKARELLVSTNMTVKDLSRALHFNSHNYFCRVFRAAYDTSPARYRREHKS